MELLLSSPIALAAAGVLLPIIVGVFLYELRNQRKQKEAPKANFVPPVISLGEKPSVIAPKPVPPPAKAPPQVTPAAARVASSPQTIKKKGSHKVVYGIVGILVLGGGLATTVYLAGMPQSVLNFAKTPVVSVTPFVSSFPATITPLTQISTTPAISSSLPVPTRSSLLAAAGVTLVPTVIPAKATPTVTPIKIVQLPQTGVGATPTVKPVAILTLKPTAKPTVKPTAKPTSVPGISQGPVVPQTPAAGSTWPTVIIAFAGLLLLGLSLRLAL